jgi:hypothetical protein
MLVCGLGLLWKRTEALAARVLFPYWALVVLLLKIPLVVKNPVAAGLGVLFEMYPRLAAAMEAAMLSAFTGLVWIPAILATPTKQFVWPEFTISWAISAGAWVVAASIAKKN